MDKAYFRHKFSSLEHEIRLLKEISKLWQGEDGFWNWKEIVKSCNSSDVSVWYITSGSESDSWKGILVSRSIVNDAELLYIFVEKGSRHKSIAAYLIEGMISEYLSTHKIENIFLEVRLSNISAIKLYEKYGFMRDGIRKRYYKNGDDALIYKKDLMNVIN
jgi:ribosomal-protein-alanine N-acetyltransferase